MIIAGFVKNSFVDYPGKIASTIFTAGCNMRCWYCHNSHILENFENKVEEDFILNFLKERKGFIDAVVISGGEPTLQKDLKEFIKKIKVLGYLIKLDTNGSNYEVLKSLIDENLLDYVAMDIKAPLNKYSKITNTKIDIDNIKKSIELLIENKVDYEFRTTFSPDLTLEDIEEICASLKGAKNYVIQKYNVVEYNKINMPLRKKEDHIKAKNIALKYINNVILKGI